MPRPDNAIFALSRAMAKLSMYETPLEITPATKQFFTALVAHEHAADVGLLSRRRRRRSGASTARRFGGRVDDPLLHSLIRNTLAPVIINGGFRAQRDSGFGAGDDQPADDSGDEHGEVARRVAPRDRGQHDRAEGSDDRGRAGVGVVVEDTDLYRALERAAKATFPGAEVTPYLFQAGTDAGAWRARGIPVYGIYPYPIDADELTRMHGNDEKVSVESLKQGTEMIYRDAWWRWRARRR